MAIADPRDIPGLLVWYSAEYELTQYTPVTGTVTVLHDLSGNGNHTDLLGAGNPKVYATGGPAGGARLVTGTSGVWSMPNIFSGKTAAEGMMTVNPDGNCRGPWGIGGAGQDQYFPFSDTNIYSDFGSTTRYVFGVGTKPVVSTWRTLDEWSASNDWAHLVDGTTIHSSSSNTVSLNTDPWFGAFPNAGNPNGINVGVMVLYGRKLTTTERADLNTWMAAHPSGGGPTILATVSLAATSTLTTAAVVVPAVAPSLDARIIAGFQRVAAEFNTVRGEIGTGGVDEVFVGPGTPPDAATELWYDTDDPGTGGGGGGVDEVWVGPDTPPDTATELWYDTDDPGVGGGGGGVDEVWVGPSTPTDPATELWYDTDDPGVSAPVFSGFSITQVKFTSSGTFTKATYPTAFAVKVRLVGGGGGGGGASVTIGTAGAGGGGGGYAEKWLPIASLAASVAVNVGAGGAGAGGANAGGTGGSSSFGSHVVTTGGSGGGFMTLIDTGAYGGLGGGGAGSSGGDLHTIGMAGLSGWNADTITAGGAGGSSALGAGGRGSAAQAGGQNGDPGEQYGGGGAGARNSGAGNATGGDGAAGVVIIEVYG